MELLQKFHKSHLYHSLCLTQSLPSFNTKQIITSVSTESKAGLVIRTLNKRCAFCVQFLLICYLSINLMLVGILSQAISDYYSCLFWLQKVMCASNLEWIFCLSFLPSKNSSTYLESFFSLDRVSKENETKTQISSLLSPATWLLIWQVRRRKC